MNFTLKKSDLNFKVYTVAAKPTAPGAENDIAIISSVSMTNWIMSPEKPSGIPRNDGDVWIRYSTKGDTKNILKQNVLMIATISAWQFVGGAWVDVEAMSYQNGEWVERIEYLYKPGMVSGLSPVAWKAVSGQVGVAPVVTYNDDSAEIKLTGGGGSNGVAYFDKKDLSKFSRVHVSLHIEPTFSDSGLETGLSGNCFNIWEAVGTGYYEKRYAVRHSLVPGQNDFDIPLEGLDGEYYMGVGMRTSSDGYRTTKLYEVKLIP